VTEAPAFSVVADVAIVKGETPASDRTWLSFPDGTARRAVVHVTHDLPHLVVESVPPGERSALFDQAADLLDLAGWGLDELFEASQEGAARDELLGKLGLLET